MASFSVQLEQDDRLTYSLSLISPSEEKKKLQRVGQYFKDITTNRKISTVEMDLLVPG